MERSMEYKDLKICLKASINSAAQDFFNIGKYLRQIRENEMYTEDGYKNIWDFAKTEYGLSVSSASRFMAINERFSIDGGRTMSPKYVGLGVSKLQEMLALPDEELDKVTSETTVKELRDMKAKLKEETEEEKQPLSFFGLPATVRPAGSLINTPGCGDGKHDCFRCGRDCNIRQEERYCRFANMGNPFPCAQMGKSFKINIQCMPHKNQCQILHQELADINAGNHEPDPCCAKCDIKSCAVRCDVATKKDEGEREKQEEEERLKRVEAEANKADVIDAEFKEITEEPPAVPEKTAQGPAEEPEPEEDPLCDGCVNASALTGDVDLCRDCGPDGSNYCPIAPEEDPKEYALRDVQDMLDQAEKDLRDWIEAEMPLEEIRKRYILRDALKMFASKIKKGKRAPIYESDGYSNGVPVYDMANCPTCGHYFEYQTENWRCGFCPECGQELDWSELEEETDNE